MERIFNSFNLLLCYMCVGKAGHWESEYCKNSRKYFCSLAMHSQKSVQVPSLVRIATLENGKVTFDEETLKSIDSETSNYPVAVVSVIGRTREQRGAAVKALVGHLYREATDESCVLNATESEISEADAIVAVFPPGNIINEFGVELAVLILDISCLQYASPAYYKLASLCLRVSSVVAHTASYNGDKMSSINTEISELQSLSPAILSVNHVWIIMQDCDPSICLKPDAASLLAAKYETLTMSESTTKNVLMLAGYSESAIRTLLALKIKDCSRQGDSAEYNVTWEETCEFILRAATQIPGINLSRLVPYFTQKWCPAEPRMELVNPTDSCRSSLRANDASALSQSALMEDIVTTYSSRGRGREVRSFQNEQQLPGIFISPDSPTPLKFDTKETNSADVEPIEVHSTNTMSSNKNKEGIPFRGQSGDDVSTESKKISTGDLGKQRDAIPADKCLSTSRGVDTGAACIQTKPTALTLSKESVSELLNIDFEAEDCKEQVPEPMEVNPSHETVSLSTGFMDNDIEKCLWSDLPRVHKFVSENLRSASFSTPLDPQDMEAVDDSVCQRSTMLPKATMWLEEINEKPTTSSSDAQGPIVRQAHVFDAVVAKNAIKYSLERYDEFMGRYVPPDNIYPIKFIKDVHELACRNVLGAFSSHELSPPAELQSTMYTLIRERLESNFAMMRKLDKREEKLGQMCGMYYKDKMSTEMGETAMSLEKAREVHQKFSHDTKQLFRQQCEDVLEPIKVYWEQVLNVKLEFWRAYYMDKLGVKQDLIKSVSVGIYFGPDVVQFGLYSSDMETFNRSCVEILPFISFKDGKILIGDEAKKSGTFKYNVFEVLSRPTGIIQRRPVKLYSKSFSLTSNEVAVLFFHEAKKQFECSVKTKVGTCAVAASGLLPSASKQGLVSALSMSGFTLVRFIPSTTAILVWYLYWRQVQPQPPKSARKNPRVLVIHQTGPLVEVVKADILAEQQLYVRRIGGFLNDKDFNEPRGGTVVQFAIRQEISEVIESSKDFEQVIMVHGGQNDPMVIQSILDIIGLAFYSGHCEQQSRYHILFSAAAYDADNNGDASVSTHSRSFPKFNHLFPHKLSIQANRTSEAMEYPSTGSERRSITFEGSARSFNVFESKGSKMCFHYPFSLNHSSSSKVEINVTLRHDGTFNISGAPLTCHNCQFISDFSRIYMEKQVADVISAGKQFMEKINSSCHTRSTLNENVVENLTALNTAFRCQLEDVKQRLGVSRNLIKPMILEGIDARIKACEKLLGQRGVKEKQLNVAMEQLKVAANRIPSTN